MIGSDLGICRLWLFDKFMFVLEELDGLLQPNRMEFGKESLWVQFHNLLLACMNREIRIQIGIAT